MDPSILLGLALIITAGVIGYSVGRDGNPPATYIINQPPPPPPPQPSTSPTHPSKSHPEPTVREFVRRDVRPVWGRNIHE